MSKKVEKTKRKSPRKRYKIYFKNDIDAGRFIALYFDFCSPMLFSRFENCDEFPYYVELFSSKEFFEQVRSAINLTRKVVGQIDGCEYANWVFE